MEDANGWEDFLFEQIEIIVEASDSGNKEAEYELSGLYYLTNIHDLNKSFYTKSIEYLKTKLNSENPEVRKAALENILDLHFESKLQLKPDLIEALQSQLYDKSFDVRHDAYLDLKDFDLIPNQFQRSLMDKIRIKMSQGYRSLMKPPTNELSKQ